MNSESLIEAFNEAGPRYREAGSPFLDHFASVLAERASPRQGAAVVDLATGPGTLVAPLVKAVGAGGSVIGIDLAERQLQLARSALESVAARVRFVQMDACALDLADRSADAVTCAFGLPYFQAPLRAIREAARVARANAAVAFTVWGDPFFGRPGERLLQALERHEVPLRHRRFTSEPQELAQWFFRAGLRDVVIEEHEFETTFATFDVWWEMNRAFAFLVRLDTAPDAVQEAVREGLAEDSSVVAADDSVTCSMRVYLARAVA